MMDEFGERIELSDDVQEIIRQRDVLQRLPKEKQLELYKKAWHDYNGHWTEFDLYKELWKAYQEAEVRK